jgi:hypothetical protein
MMVPSWRKLIGHALLQGCTIGGLLVNCAGQTPAIANQTSADPGVASTKAQMTSMRDDFVKAAVAAGFRCPIAPPDILVVEVPSFGSYDRQSNQLKTPAWEQLTDDERGRFYRLLGPGTSEAAARAEFETGAHHWVFVHEMGHWWQACRGVADLDKDYAMEFGANRIAAAYWRERDPQLIAHQRAKFEALLKRSPSPVAEGQDLETYFDSNYEKLGPTPAYIWFQARMCITAFDEKPEPTFAQALKQTTP